MNQLKFATKAIHKGQAPEKLTGAITVPIFQTSTYSQIKPGETISGYEYSRTKNPTRDRLEENLAALENAKHGICFASGLASIDAVLHLLNAGDHVVLGDDVYGGTYRLFAKVFSRVNIEFSIVDMGDINAVNNAITEKTKLVWLETPTNPMLKIVDIKKITTAVKKKNKNILVAVDNTFATPALQNPLDLGADIVCHSSTKYLGGHSDVVGGTLIVNNDSLAEELRFLQNSIGAIPAPLDCYLLLRSTKTLSLRMERHCSNAMHIAKFLSSHPNVEKVFYPGLENHPNHSIAKSQMTGFGGMISVEVKGGTKGANKLCTRTKLFCLAESLGAVESLISVPAIMTHAAIPAENRAKLGITNGLVRLSVGIEDVSDLEADLAFALD